MSERKIINTRVGDEIRFESEEVDGRGDSSRKRKEKGLVVEVYPYHVMVIMPGGYRRSVCLGDLVRFGYEDIFPPYIPPIRYRKAKKRNDIKA